MQTGLVGPDRLIDEPDQYRLFDLPIFERELREWLPSRIFDVHAHTWLAEHLRRPIAEDPVELLFNVESVTWEELTVAYRVLFPGVEVERLALPMPLRVVDIEANNAYLASRIDNERSFALLAPELDASPEELWHQIVSGRFVGFKPYLSQVRNKSLEEIRILDFVRPAQLEVADRAGLLIMLHVPRPSRLADCINRDDLVAIADSYPGARIVLAHAGRAYAPEILAPALDVLTDLPNVLWDLSNIQDHDVVRLLLERVPIDRIMWGSDIPVATVRGRLLMLNGQRVCLTRRPFPWSVSRVGPEPLACTFMGYETLRALRRACDELALSREQVSSLMYANARALVVGALDGLTAA
ncbi:MAG: amidohydrolase family protein [Chloroflexi bacterium]|nr:amidohydrolase family protein [Chloroflexota bacterium]